MIDYLRYFFNPSHLFDLRPPLMQPRALLILGVLFGAMVVLGVFLTFILKQKRDALKIKGLRRLRSLLITMGIIGGVFWFFSQQGLPLLSARFWLLIWLAVTLLWLAFILKYLFLVVPKQRDQLQKQRDFDKYLP